MPILALVGQSATSRSPKFQETDAGGSRDVQVLRGLLGAVSEVRSADGLHPALESGSSGAAEWGVLPPWRYPWMCRHARVRPHAPPVGSVLLGLCQRRERCRRRGHANISGRRWRSRPVPSCGQCHRGPGPLPRPDGCDRALGRVNPPEARIFVDAGQGRHAAHVVLGPLGAPFYDCPRSAPMGWAIAAAVGAALALRAPFPLSALPAMAARSCSATSSPRPSETGRA